MNPLFVDLAGTAVRFALAGLTGYLVRKGVFTDAQASSLTSAVVLGVLTLAWALWVRYRSRLKFLTAAASNGPVSEHEVEANVRAGNAPPATIPKNRPAYLPGKKPVAGYGGPDMRDSV